MLGKIAKHCVFPMICGSVGSKSGLAKAAGAESPVQMRNEKLHTAAARSTFSSQNAQSTPCSDHFWNCGCPKMAHRSGATYIFKSKCTKHTMSMFGPFLEVRMSKNCAPLWREVHFQVKMHKTHHAMFGPLLEVQISKNCTPEAKMFKKTPCSDYFWQFRCRKIARCCGAKHLCKQKCFQTNTTFGLLLAAQMSNNCTPLWREAHL